MPLPLARCALSRSSGGTSTVILRAVPMTSNIPYPIPALNMATAYLEDNLHRKLNPPWVLGRDYLPERRRSHEIIRQIEIRAVQKIEEFRPKLQVEPLADGGVLDNREVHCPQAWAVQDVAARIAKVPIRRGRERRRVEPLPRRRIRKPGVANHIRPVVGAETQLRDAGVGVVAIRQQRHGERLAGLKRQHAETLPPAHPAMALENRQIVRVAEREALADVEIGAAPFRARFVTVLWKVRISGGFEDPGRIVNRLCVGVGRQQRQSLPKAPLEPPLQAVISRVGLRLDDVDFGEIRVRTGVLPIDRRLRLVDIARIDQMRALRSYVGNLKHPRFAKLPLDAEIPLLYIGRAKVALEGDRRSWVWKREVTREWIRQRQVDQSLNRIINIEIVVRRAKVKAFTGRQRGLLVVNPIRRPECGGVAPARRPRQTA